MSVGLANHLLTLCERAPGLVLPIVVTEILSPEATAVWYIVWMSAWVVFTAPVSMGIAEFAESGEETGESPRNNRGSYQGITHLCWRRCGDPGRYLRPLCCTCSGPDYAQAGVLPLRLLLIGVVPLSVVSAYDAYCRASRRLSKCSSWATVRGAASIVIPAVAGTQYGLSGMAIAWVTVQMLTAICSGARLWMRLH